MTLQPIAWQLMSEEDYGNYIVQTWEQERGSLEERYNIYVDCMAGTGEYVQTFDEWLES